MKRMDISSNNDTTIDNRRYLIYSIGSFDAPKIYGSIVGKENAKRVAKSIYKKEGYEFSNLVQIAELPDLSESDINIENVLWGEIETIENINIINKNPT